MSTPRCASTDKSAGECTFQLGISIQGNLRATAKSGPHETCCLLPCMVQDSFCSHAHLQMLPGLACRLLRGTCTACLLSFPMQATQQPTCYSIIRSHLWAQAPDVKQALARRSCTGPPRAMLDAETGAPAALPNIDAVQRPASSLLLKVYRWAMLIRSHLGAQPVEQCKQSVPQATAQPL